MSMIEYGDRNDWIERIDRIGCPGRCAPAKTFCWQFPFQLVLEIKRRNGGRKANVSSGPVVQSGPPIQLYVIRTAGR
jgi:hypothetical protein